MKNLKKLVRNFKSKPRILNLNLEDFDGGRLYEKMTDFEFIFPNKALIN